MAAVVEEVGKSVEKLKDEFNGNDELIDDEVIENGASEASKKKKRKKKKKKAEVLYSEVPGLFGALRQERARLAKVQGVPAFVVFSDATLHDMCKKLPKNQEEFLTVSGVGRQKAEKYGKQFIKVIKQYF